MGTSRQTDKPLQVNSEAVHLELTPAQWVSCCQRTGAWYLGGCCGNMSAVQDLMLGAFRNGGSISHRDLAEMCKLLRGHDGYDVKDLPDIRAAYQELRAERGYSPWVYVLWAWEESGKQGDVKGNDKPSWDQDPLVNAIHTAVDGLGLLSFALLERNLFDNTPVPLEDTETKKPRSDYERAQRRLHVANLVPALRTLLEGAARLDILPSKDPWKGFALRKGDDVLSLVSGPAIRSTEVEAAGILTHNGLGQDSGWTVVPVEITLEHGLVFPQGN